MTSLSEKEAYVAIFTFLEQRYKMTNSNDLGALLGSMAVLEDGGPADPEIGPIGAKRSRRQYLGTQTQTWD